MKKINLFFVLLCFTIAAPAQVTANFDSLMLGANSYWDGSDLSGGFTNGNAYFENQYDTSFGGYWAGGFIYTNQTDSTTAGYTNPASAITASGVNGSSNYAIAYDEGDSNVIIRLTGNAAGRAVQGFYVTNTTYAYLSMLHGDHYDSTFSAANKDSLVLRIYGYKNGSLNPNYIGVYLADFRFPDTTQNYILKKWQWVNLLSLGNVDSLLFTMVSSQSSGGYYNTPTYFAMDNFVTSDLATQYDTILYNQDTLLNVLSGVVDTANGPFTVSFVSNLTGASVIVDSANRIWYIPQSGIVGTDVVTYVVCNSNNVCDTAQVVIELRSPTGIEQINALQTTVYPNPFSGSFSVTHTTGVKTVELYDLTGRLVQVTPCNTSETVTIVNTITLETGTYLLKVTTDEGSGIAKVIKQ